MPIAAQNLRMSGYGQFCPVARASEIFAERWTPLILREIRAGNHHFSEILKGLHRASPSVLGQRLRSLERLGVVESRPNPSGRGSTYHLTEAGVQLAAIIEPLGAWGQRWLEIGPEHMDPDVLMWKLFKHLDASRLPVRRRVARFELDGVRRRYWLVLSRDDPDLCYSDPGFGDDLVVHATVEALIRVYLGQLPLAEAVRCGQVRLDGSGELARGMTEWFPRSGFAPHARPMSYDVSKKSFVMQPA
ncbi:MAG TPA: helix-turn-helix domain-containing protein [Candidatus Dormibacteraeota bacterium]|nr:helix-turn-helix domain-containing protein [Candidatus Dormibacteraeota bacterium]